VSNGRPVRPDDPVSNGRPDDPVTGRRDDPVTGRRILTESAYADDSKIRSRQAIFAFADQRPGLSWRTAPVAWDGTQVVLDAGCGNGLDLRRIVAQGSCRRVVGMDLSAGMLRSVRDCADPDRVWLVQADVQQCPLRDASVDVAMAMHMLYHVPDVPAAVRELRRVLRPGGTLLASTNAGGSMSQITAVFESAVSRLLGRPVRTMPPLSFTTETGAQALRREFADVTLYSQVVTLSVPGPEPVVAYIDSVREPILSYVGEQFDFDAALAQAAASVSREVAERGAFRVTASSGVFACR
jgi:SAM-dependent methyltransferase